MVVAEALLGLVGLGLVGLGLGLGLGWTGAGLGLGLGWAGAGLGLGWAGLGLGWAGLGLGWKCGGCSLALACFTIPSPPGWGGPSALESGRAGQTVVGRGAGAVGGRRSLRGVVVGAGAVFVAIEPRGEAGGCSEPGLWLAGTGGWA